MSYDPTMARCPRCGKWVELALEYEVRNGEEMHTACAIEQDRDDGVCDLCPALAPYRNGKPVYPVHHGSGVGLCTWCVSEGLSMGTL